MVNGSLRTGSVTLRALSLLDTFLPGNERLQLSEMARAAGLPLSTAHRLTNDLVAWGALDRTPEGLYMIGAKLRQVSSMASRGRLLREICLPSMEDLSANTGYPSVLAILEADDVIFVERVTGHRFIFRPQRNAGSGLATAAGRVLAAYAGPAVQESLLQHTVSTTTGLASIGPEQLRRELAEIRTQGHVVTSGQLKDEMTALAAPIWDPSTRQVIAALSLVIPPDAADIDVSLALCKAASRAIARAMEVS
ncbi:hypothetical protein BLJ79_06235 [Arthrobacter sp. UCD-GKA]|uniref:IclR family transcriptional regulator n=1 Tax=Arthrobacter sp. UCD-GKA TaxID=1913576 RepID=UPI0008DDCACF|nr:IclR family transcriptional regulator [Arthrobacter sp. UCD-GKA]OIH85745.1 hypothetical protein BLJ79_06235 [Arthrobacter sp. UCD-GKA]